MHLLLGRITFALFGDWYFFSFIAHHPAVKRHSTHKNVVVHSKIIDFEHCGNSSCCSTPLWEEFGRYSAQVVRTGAAR